jgi:hypothetical protein
MTTHPRTIIIPGGAGYLGRHLAQFFAQQSYSVVILSRQPQPDRDDVRYLQWDGATPGDWARSFEAAAAVINLAGRTVNCRYNARNKRQIYESRLRSTAAVGAAIAACDQPPAVWINASSATIYRDAYDRPMDEATGEIGTGFSVDVCQRWEQTLFAAHTPQTRKIALRTAIVFGNGSGGAMEPFERIVRLGLGGKMGSGRQFVSWVHLDDFARSVQWLIEHDELAGPINCAAPHPLPNAAFMRTLRQVCRQPIGLPATRWMLEIGAFALRTETELLLKSRRVVPGRLLESGFQFRYPELRPALEQIVNG